MIKQIRAASPIEAIRGGRPSETRQCARCGQPMKPLRTEEHWSHGRGYILSWLRCPGCGMVELGGWKATDLAMETRPRPA